MGLKKNHSSQSKIQNNIRAASQPQKFNSVGAKIEQISRRVASLKAN